MNKPIRSLILGLAFTAITFAAEIPPTGQIVRPPESPKSEDQDRVISQTHQFNVGGSQIQDRAAVAILAEETKNELLQLTAEQDTWKVPISITLHGKIGDPLPPRTEVLQLVFNDSGYNLRLDLHLSRGIDRQRIKHAITAALINERALRDHSPSESTTRFLVPPWLVDGLREASAWYLDQSDRRLYQTLFKTGGLFKTEELFALDQAGFEHIDAAMGTAFRISSAALVMALIQQPQGKEGFRSFLSEVATYQGEMPSLLRKHFPGLNLSETSLAKWWALQLANTGGQNLTTEILTIDQTETALNQALNFNFSDAESVLQQKELNAWPELAALPAPERSQALEFAQEALVRLSYRCFPSYRPLLAEYQIALGAIAKKSTQNLATQLQALTEQRTVMTTKAKQGRDYLKLFEVTRAYESSGAFDNYIRFTEQLKTNHRTDKCSKYLDLLETAFNPKIDAMLPKLTKQ